MKRFLTIFFVVLGIIFFLIILILTYLFIFDPLNIKPLFIDNKESQVVANNVNEAEVEITTNATTTNDIEADQAKKSDTSSTSLNLSANQETALKSIGIEPEMVPQSFTSTQLTCFEEVLGKERVDEIKAGDTPNLVEFYKAKECI